MSDDEIVRQIRELRERVNQYWRHEFGSNDASLARYSGSAQQAPIPNNAVTIVDFQTMTYDPDSLVTTGAAWHFTAAIAGYYAVEAMILFTAADTWADVEWGSIYLYKNGAVFSSLDRKDNYSSASTVFMELGGGDLVYLAATDTLDIRLFQNSGAALDLDSNPIYNHVAIWKV